MPKVSDMKESKFLKQSDVGKGLLATITGCVQENVAMIGEAPELKWCLTFRECKPLVLNSTNAQLCAHFLGSDDTDHWIGKHIVMYTDPTVSFGGKIVGGIRVRAPKPGAALPADPEPEPPFDDDVPF